MGAPEQGTCWILASGTFEQVEDSRESTASRAATVGNILDRPAWWPPCDVRWRYRVVVGGNATCACAARNADSALVELHR
jgi:hypothetical protein